MESLFYTYAVLQIATFAFWFYTILVVLPKEGKVGFVTNFKNGGWFVLYGYSFLSFALAFAVWFFIGLSEFILNRF